MDKIFQEKVFKVPYFLFSDRYKKLNFTAKLLYGILYTALLNKMQKAEDENKDSSSFRDKAGIFVEFDIDNMANLIGQHPQSIYRLLNLLEIAGLISRISDNGLIRVYFKL